MNRFRVVICGAGIAGIEALLKLHRLVGDQVEITLVAPNPLLDMRPLSVLEPFDRRAERHHPVARIVRDTGSSLVAESLSWVDRHEHVVHTDAGRSLPYDALLLTVGGRPRPVSPHLDVFTAQNGQQTLAGIVAKLGAGRTREIAFVVPPAPSWTIPLYELALLTAHRARERAAEVSISVVTPEPRPLHLFGAPVAETMAELLKSAGVRLYCAAEATMPRPQTLLLDSGVELRPQHAFTLPRITGPDVRGIPGDPVHRFLEIDLHCRVGGTDGHVFAAGDATNFPLKLGAIGAQQADTAADGIAHLAGLGPRSLPLHPRIAAVILTGDEPLYLSAHVIAGEGWHAVLHREPPWDPAQKAIAPDLNAYLKSLHGASV